VTAGQRPLISEQVVRRITDLRNIRTMLAHRDFSR
jgi:hypothetical protein